MPLITVNQVNCKDCYKCVRFCPVKAIRVVNGHAEVVEARCLHDGNCVAVCPQHAKQVRRDLDVVRGLLAGGRTVVASVAPSAAGVFGDRLPRVLGALRALGFSRIEETARTAEATARATARYAAQHDGPAIATACPAVVALVERYYPQHVDRLAPVASPMVAHARLLREEYGPDTAVVFIGPCIAKKAEAGAGEIDAALTFDELGEWLAAEPVDADPSGYDNAPVGVAGLFPLPGGLLRSADLPTDILAAEVVTAHGLEETMALLDAVPEMAGVRLIEALACTGGCLQGPGAQEGAAAWARRAALLAHCPAAGTGAAPADLHAVFAPAAPPAATPSDAEIAAILHRTGKLTPADEHNCGACGYDTCREKAVAVFEGMAEAEMCIPYMRSRAESLANVVLRNTPNGIVVVDDALRILDANPAFERLTGAPLADLIGRPVRTVVDAQGFERVARTRRPFVRQELPHGNVIVRELVVPVEGEEMLIGLYIDVTEDVAHRQKMQHVKAETLGKARAVIDKQMRVAQEIAGLLGETTAETKVLLTKLIQLSEDE